MALTTPHLPEGRGLQSHQYHQLGKQASQQYPGIPAIAEHAKKNKNDILPKINK
jgi:hypothetical protein